LIVDTNALSAGADRDPAVGQFFARADQLAIPVVVLGEFRYGIAQSRRKAEYETWLLGIASASRILDINEQTTLHYVDIRLENKRAGTPIPANDLWIAALCRQHSYPLLSRDRHFDVVKGVVRIAW
jgi:tRNA(fMet)-specific endonuclease VapC